MIGAGHETDRFSTREVVVSGIVLVVAIGLTFLVCVPLFNWLSGHYAGAGETMMAGVDRRPPPPRLQVDPAADLDALRQREDEILAGRGWVDRARGIARIPIAEAMARVAKGELAAEPREVPPQPAMPPAPVTPRSEPLPVTIGGGHAPEEAGAAPAPGDQGRRPAAHTEGRPQPGRREDVR